MSEASPVRKTADLGWEDEILVDGRRTAVPEMVQRKMAQLAVAAGRRFDQPLFQSPLRDDFTFDDGSAGRLECWTEVDGNPWHDDAAARQALKVPSFESKVVSFRRLTVTGRLFSVTCRQIWTCWQSEHDGDIRKGGPDLDAMEAEGDLVALLRFLRVCWRRPLRLVRPPFRDRRFFLTYVATGVAVEVEDDFELGRKLSMWETTREIEDDYGRDTERPTSAFIDFVEALSGDLVIDRRASNGRTHSTLVFEFRSEAEDFTRLFTGERPRRSFPRLIPFR